MCTLECYECRPGCGAKFFNAFDNVPQGHLSLGGMTQGRITVYENRRAATGTRAGHNVGAGGMPVAIERVRSVLYDGFETDHANSNEALAAVQDQITKLKEELRGQP